MEREERTGPAKRTRSQVSEESPTALAIIGEKAAEERGLVPLAAAGKRGKKEITAEQASMLQQLRGQMTPAALSFFSTMYKEGLMFKGQTPKIKAPKAKDFNDFLAGQSKWRAGNIRAEILQLEKKRAEVESAERRLAIVEQGGVQLRSKRGREGETTLLALSEQRAVTEGAAAGGRKTVRIGPAITYEAAAPAPTPAEIASNKSERKRQEAVARTEVSALMARPLPTPPSRKRATEAEGGRGKVTATVAEVAAAEEVLEEMEEAEGPYTVEDIYAALVRADVGAIVAGENYASQEIALETNMEVWDEIMRDELKMDPDRASPYEVRQALQRLIATFWDKYYPAAVPMQQAAPVPLQTLSQKQGPSMKQAAMNAVLASEAMHVEPHPLVAMRANLSEGLPQARATAAAPPPAPPPSGGPGGNGPPGGGGELPTGTYTVRYPPDRKRLREVDVSVTGADFARLTAHLPKRGKRKEAKLLTVDEMAKKNGPKKNQEGKPVPASVKQSPSWKTWSEAQRREYASRFGYSYEGSLGLPHAAATGLPRYTGNENGYLAENVNYPLAATNHRGTMVERVYATTIVDGKRKIAHDASGRPILQTEEKVVGPRKGGVAYLPSGSVQTGSGVDKNGTPYTVWSAPKQWRSRSYLYMQRPRPGKRSDGNVNGKYVFLQAGEQLPNGQRINKNGWYGLRHGKETPEGSPIANVAYQVPWSQIGGIHPKGLDRPGSLPETELFGSDAAASFTGRTDDGQPNGSGTYAPGPDKAGPVLSHHKMVPTGETYQVDVHNKQQVGVTKTGKPIMKTLDSTHVETRNVLKSVATTENKSSANSVPGNAGAPAGTSIEQDVRSEMRAPAAGYYNRRFVHGAPVFGSPMGAARFVGRRHGRGAQTAEQWAKAYAHLKGTEYWEPVRHKARLTVK